MENRSSTPTSSPPQSRTKSSSGEGSISPPSRKRSREKMEQRIEAVTPSSAARLENDEKFDTEATSQSKQIDSSVTVQALSSAAHNMSPLPTPTQDAVLSSATIVPKATRDEQMTPPVTGSTMPPPASKPPRSGQTSANQNTSYSQIPAGIKKPSKAQTTLGVRARPEPVSRRHSNEDLNERMYDETDSDATETPSIPSEPIEVFAWEDLERRYHDQMEELQTKEADIWAELSSLNQYFAVWAKTSQGHEVDRSFKRLKTQSKLVQHREGELENKRQHYVKVVEAFQSALLLLGN